jgi:hypothetical protein
MQSPPFASSSSTSQKNAGESTRSKFSPGAGPVVDSLSELSKRRQEQEQSAPDNRISYTERESHPTASANLIGIQETSFQQEELDQDQSFGNALQAQTTEKRLS